MEEGGSSAGFIDSLVKTREMIRRRTESGKERDEASEASDKVIIKSRMLTCQQ